MTKSEQAQAEVIQLLFNAGFTADGETARTAVRVPTVANPLFGKAGGVLTTFGGRVRFAKPGTNIRATVGTRTVCLYRVHPGRCHGDRVSHIAMLRVKDIDELKAAVATLQDDPQDSRESPNCGS